MIRRGDAIVCAAVGVLLVSSCASTEQSAETSQQISKGACGRVVTTAEGTTTEYPASDFGAGLVGMNTEAVDRAGIRRQRFALYNPSNARLVRVDAPEGADLFSAIDKLFSDEPTRQSLTRFARAARALGYQVREGRADPAGHPRLACVTQAFKGSGQAFAPAAIPRTDPVDGRLLLP